MLSATWLRVSGPPRYRADAILWICCQPIRNSGFSETILDKLDTRRLKNLAHPDTEFLSKKINDSTLSFCSRFQPENKVLRIHLEAPF